MTPKDTEKEKAREEQQKSYKIQNFYDLLQALKENPDWLLELRQLLLTNELIELPAKFEKFVKEVRERLEKLEQDVAILKEDVAILKQDVAILKQDVAILKGDVNYLKGEFGRYKGKEFERTIREKFYSYFGTILRRAKLISGILLLHKLEDLEDQGLITLKEKADLLNIDLVVKGIIPSNKKMVYLAVEVSYTLFEEDLKRSARRANLLHNVFKEEVIPAVVFVEGNEEIIKKGEESGIYLLKVEY